MVTDKIILKDINKTYTLNDKKVTVFENFSMEFDPGMINVIIGKSGCGKTTLLRMIAGLEKPDSGELIIPEELKVGMVFQEDRLMPWLSCEKNVTLGLKGVDRNAVYSVLETVGLKGFEKAYPSQLSGGMRQRVSLARMLIRDSNLLLMDEPFSALDAFTRKEMQEELLRMRKEMNAGIIFVTHDMNEAMLLGDRIITLGGEKIQERGKENEKIN